jgi:hypothetical protein
VLEVISHGGRGEIKTTKFSKSTAGLNIDKNLTVSSVSVDDVLLTSTNP